MSNQFESLAGLFGIKTPTDIEVAPVAPPGQKEVILVVDNEPATETVAVDNKTRTKIGTPFLVTFKISRKPFPEETPTGIKYLKYGIPIGEKKYVNFFIHDMPDIKKGDQITAEAQICRTELKNGRTFVHIDLRPTKLGATRKIIILPDKRNVPDNLRMGTYVQSLPNPMKAAVAFVPIKN